MLIASREGRGKSAAKTPFSPGVLGLTTGRPCGCRWHLSACTDCTFQELCLKRSELVLSKIEFRPTLKEGENGLDARTGSSVRAFGEFISHYEVLFPPWLTRPPAGSDGGMWF